MLKTFLLGISLVGVSVLSTATISTFTPTSYELGYRDIRSYEGYRTATPSMGEVPVLVIPISFSDYACDALEKGCEGTKADIHTTFFGQEEELRWHSVSSFYHTSSYGQLSLTGMVTDWYTPEITAVSLSNQSGLLNSRITNPAIQWFKETYQTTGAEFDTDGDGYLDAVYFVYSVDFDPKDEAFGTQKDVFWAFVSYIGGLANPSNPSMFHYGWSSYQFMYNDGVIERSENGKFLFDEDNDPLFEPYRDQNGELEVNAHVFIHEFGHLFGLEDYYSYDRSLGDWGPLGGLDMMDFNVGDHNPFSKSILGWTFPTVVTGTTTLTLSAFQDSGEFLLLTPEYEHTLLDEYLLVELYTPTGLHQKDATEPYAGRYPRQFTETGVKIYHIDARVGEYLLQEGRWQFTRYVTEAPQRSNMRYDIAHANTASRSLNPNFKLIHLLESSGKNTFINGGFATNATLFQPGDQLDNYRLNEDILLGYRLEVITLQNNTVTLAITKV